MCKNIGFKHNNIRCEDSKKGIKVLFSVDICRAAYYTLTNEPSAVRADAQKKRKEIFHFLKDFPQESFSAGPVCRTIGFTEFTGDEEEVIEVFGGCFLSHKCGDQRLFTKAERQRTADKRKARHKFYFLKRKNLICVELLVM